MQRLKSPEQAQRLLSTHDMIYGHFRPRRHLMTAAQYQRARAKAFRIWRQETCAQLAAWASVHYCRVIEHAPCPGKLTVRMSVSSGGSDPQVD